MFLLLGFLYIIGALYSLTLFDKLGTFALVYIISCIISSIICFSLDNTAKSTKMSEIKLNKIENHLFGPETWQEKEAGLRKIYFKSDEEFRKYWVKQTGKTEEENVKFHDE